MSDLKLKRSPERWAAMSSNAVAEGSKAQMMYAIEDAQSDIATLSAEISRLRKEVEDLREALDILQRTKGRTTDPDDDGLLGLGM